MNPLPKTGTSTMKPQLSTFTGSMNQLEHSTLTKYHHQLLNTSTGTNHLKPLLPTLQFKFNGLTTTKNLPSMFTSSNHQPIPTSLRRSCLLMLNIPNGQKNIKPSCPSSPKLLCGKLITKPPQLMFITMMSLLRPITLKLSSPHMLNTTIMSPLYPNSCTSNPPFQPPPSTALHE